MFNDNGSFLLALFEFFLFFAWFMCLFWVFGDIFRSKDLGGGAKTFWVFFVIFLPWLGILVYLIARGGGMSQRAMEQQAEAHAAQADYIQSVAASSVGSSTDQIASAKSLLDSGRDHPGRVRCSEGQGARLIRSGLPRQGTSPQGPAHDEGQPHPEGRIVPMKTHETRPQ